MERRSVNRIAVPIALLILSAIPILMSLVRLVQIPTGTLPDDALQYMAVPVSHFTHAAAGATFGILGPIQFGRVLAGRYGRLHRVLGRVFVLAGAVLAISGLSLLWAFPGTSTPVLDIARFLASAALALCLWLSIAAVRRRQFDRHRAWMIRAYAFGMGAATIAIIMFPIYIITGAPITGLASDIAFVGSWVINVVIAEWVIARIAARAPKSATS